ncbi:unnamed protein product, partial [Phaeothamnion confervicola]
ELEADVAVVGSGAGGGCVAGVLTGRGLRIVVLEKGPLCTAADFAAWTEAEAYENLYERQALAATEDGGIAVLAGACIGGGTTVNWAASFRTPNCVRRDWSERLGLKRFAPGGPFDAALEAVSTRLGVTTERSHNRRGGGGGGGGGGAVRYNANNELLWRGAAALGCAPRPVPRNVGACTDCGACGGGCVAGAKKCTRTTWLEDAARTGDLTLFPRMRVDRVLRDAIGRATGVATAAAAAGGGPYTLTVHARAVVVAAGALHTPALLLRSGLRHPKIGRHLALHPVVGVAGLFPAIDTELDRGVGMGVVVSDMLPHADSGGSYGSYGSSSGGTGFAVETPPAHPGLLAGVLPWEGALLFRVTMAMTRHTAAFIAVPRDTSCAANRVVLGRDGEPVVRYAVTRHDRALLRHGTAAMSRLMRAAGADVVMPIHAGGRWFSCCGGSDGGRGGDGATEDASFDRFVSSLPVVAYRTPIISAHQMGSCRMAAARGDGPVGPSGEAWEAPGLFVADASTLPTSLGINPMVTVESVAWMIAHDVVDSLGASKAARDAHRGDSSMTW